jgi:hypothetical protein
MKRTLIASLLALSFAAPAAWAQDSSSVRISGFGTGALTWTDTDQAEFARFNQPSGAKKSPRTGVDSNLGLQVDYTANDWLSFTGQGLVRKDAKDAYGAELAWAFAKAKLSDSVSVRAGRMAMPTFMVSDYRNVGYANTMLRPAQEVYSQSPINSIDGVDATWQHGIGDTSLTVQLGFGRSASDIMGGARAVGSRMKTLNVVAEHGPFTLRFGQSEATVTVQNLVQIDALRGALAGAGAALKIPQVVDMANLLDYNGKKSSFSSLGLAMDWNNVVAQSEVAKRKFDNYANATMSWYVMGGYRFGQFLPYVSHAKVAAYSEFTNTIPTSCPAGYPAACTATVRTLYGTMEALRAGTIGGSQSSDSIGLRWDAFRSADIKVQIDRVRPQGAGLFVNAQPGFHGPVTVGAVAIDFVF